MFADSEILPLNVTTFAQEILKNYVTNLKNKFIINKLSFKPAIIQLDFLIKKCQVFYLFF